MELSPEEILAQLKVRGFESGFQKTPLRDFWGTLDNITGTMEKRGDSPTERLYILYNFSEMEVLKSTEPYISPVAQIEIPQSTREQSGMGVFGKSIDKIINADLPDDAEPETIKGQDYLIGKRLHMVMTGGHMMWDGRSKSEVPRECWELSEVEGEVAVEPEPVPVVKKAPAKPAVATKAAIKPASKAPTKGTTPVQAAMKELDGKTEQQFYQAVFNNPTVKADGALITQIIGREFIQPLIDAGQVTLDEDGVYHLV